MYRQIVARRGQSAFRAALLDAYQNRCAITGCDAVPALEGAHLRPYRGPDSNVVTNGLLLRADIHTLFDLQLLAGLARATSDQMEAALALLSMLAGTQYEALSTSHLADPASVWQRPSNETLEIIWQHFRGDGTTSGAQQIHDPGHDPAVTWILPGEDPDDL